MKWMKKRCIDKAKKEYILNDLELKETLAMEALFIQFDTDKSGTLEMNELFDMFKNNGIHINEQILREMFKYADVDGSGNLTVDEFKSLMTN